MGNANIVGRMTEVHNDRKSIRIIGVYPEITGLSTEIQTKYQNMENNTSRTEAINKYKGNLTTFIQLKYVVF